MNFIETTTMLKRFLNLFVHGIQPITLVPLTKNNACFLEDLNTIWDTTDTMDYIVGPSMDWLRASHLPEQGEIFLIQYDTLIIGITGYFPYGADGAVLRWHGLHEAFRGNGFSHRALNLLAKRLRSQGIKILYEATLTDAPLKYFISHGFKTLTDVVERRRIFNEAFDNRSGMHVLYLKL